MPSSNSTIGVHMGGLVDLVQKFTELDAALKKHTTETNLQRIRALTDQRQLLQHGQALFGDLATRSNTLSEVFRQQMAKDADTIAECQAQFNMNMQHGRGAERR